MRRLIYTLFFVSGACGLLYEIAWSRILTEMFGTTVLAVGTVLGAFMSGLALGSWVLGRTGDAARSPLRLYALYEIGIGVAALVSLALMDRTMPVYLWVWHTFESSRPLLAFVRFVVAFALVMAPTVLMGATLPILCRFVVSRLSRVGSDLGVLYAINTIGAVAGCVLCGFFLLGRFGVHATVYIAAAGNLAVGAVAWLVSRRATPGGATDRTEPASPAPRDVPRPALRGASPAVLAWVLVAFALSGMTSFAYEVLWTRSLVFLFGNSTYAFTLMLTAFLSGIALGGLAIRRLADRVSSPLGLFAWIEIAIGATSVAALPLLFAITHSERVRDFLAGNASDVGMLMLSRFVVALAVMLVPATLIGATFPLVGRIFVTDLGRTGTDVGRVYAVNTLGNVAGALLPGLVLLPLFGIRKGVLAMAWVNVAIGATILARTGVRGRAARVLVPAAVVAAAATLPFVVPTFRFPSQYQKPTDRVLYYEEGPAATTKVFLDPGTREKSMSIDGIVIGGTGATDYKQQLLAHLPKLFLDDYRTELSVGLGSAILAGESARHPALDAIVCVEIEPTVVEGAGYFGEESHGVLDDPRLEIVVDDVGHFLRTTDRSFDIVSADEKTAEEYASNGFSYSTDYYALLQDRLRDDGMVVQWIPNDLPPGPYRMVLRTFAESFPHVSLWYFPPVGKVGASNLIVTGTKRPFVPDASEIDRRLDAHPDRYEGIRKYGLTSAATLLAHLVARDDEVRAAVREARLNSLEHPYYEFYSIRDFSMGTDDRLAANHDLLVSLRGDRLPGDVRSRAADDRLAALDTAFEAESVYLDAFRLRMAGRPFPEFAAKLDRALAIAPWNGNLREQILPAYWNSAGAMYLAGRFDESLALMRRAAQIAPDDAEVRYYLGRALEGTGRIDRAVAEYRAAVDLDPTLVAGRLALAARLEGTDSGAAAAQYREVLRIDPEHAGAHLSLGLLRVRAGDRSEEARDLLLRALALAPEEPYVIDGAAWGLHVWGDANEARAVVRRGGTYYLENAAFAERRSAILGAGG